MTHDPTCCSSPRANDANGLPTRELAKPSHVTNGAAAFGNGVTVPAPSPSSTLNSCAAACSGLDSGTSTQIPTVTSVLNRPTSGEVLKR